MEHFRLLSIAEALNARHRTFVEKARAGEFPGTEDMELQSADCERLVEQLKQFEDEIRAAGEVLNHRMNNMLMAVQTTADYLGKAAPDGNGLERLRTRLSGAISMVQHVQREISATLAKLF